MYRYIIGIGDEVVDAYDDLATARRVAESFDGTCDEDEEAHLLDTETGELVELYEPLPPLPPDPEWDAALDAYLERRRVLEVRERQDRGEQLAIPGVTP